MSEAWEDLGGGTATATLERPHHPRCNRVDGRTDAPDPLDRVAVPCLVCRGHLVPTEYGYRARSSKAPARR